MVGTWLCKPLADPGPNPNPYPNPYPYPYPYPKPLPNPPRYDYIDFAFPSEEYRKLVIHFKINDVAFAEKSVAKRMVSEMKTGQAALSALRATDASDAAAVLRSTRALVAANMGGPYGPEVLKAIKAESDTVWKDVVSTGRPGWHMASIEIEASADTDWRVRAAKGGSEYVFVAPPASL